MCVLPTVGEATAQRAQSRAVKGPRRFGAHSLAGRRERWGHTYVIFQRFPFDDDSRGRPLGRRELASKRAGEEWQEQFISAARRGVSLRVESLYRRNCAEYHDLPAQQNHPLSQHSPPDTRICFCFKRLAARTHLLAAKIIAIWWLPRCVWSAILLQAAKITAPRWILCLIDLCPHKMRRSL
jgi:hypothetical protein